MGKDLGEMRSKQQSSRLRYYGLNVLCDNGATLTSAGLFKTYDTRSGKYPTISMYTTIVVLILAVGTGASITVYRVLDLLFLRPPPFLRRAASVDPVAGLRCD